MISSGTPHSLVNRDPATFSMYATFVTVDVHHSPVPYRIPVFYLPMGKWFVTSIVTYFSWVCTIASLTEHFKKLLFLLTPLLSSSLKFLLNIHACLRIFIFGWSTPSLFGSTLFTKFVSGSSLQYSLVRACKSQKWSLSDTWSSDKLHWGQDFLSFYTVNQIAILQLSGSTLSGTAATIHQCTKIVVHKVSRYVSQYTNTS